MLVLSRWFHTFTLSAVACALAAILGGSVAAEPAPVAAPAVDKPPVVAPQPPTDKPGPGAEQAAVPPGSDELDDVAAPFTPLNPRTGRDEDRVRALALFAAGRVAEQQQDYPLALKRYQRAFRLDPNATAALREIVPLAFNLDRQAEAVRYALIMAEHETSDPVLLRRLAIYLTEEGNTERALALYEKALAMQAARPADKPEKGAANLTLVRMEMARLYFVAKKYEQSASQFAEVLAAIDNPEKFGLDDSMKKALLNKPELTYQLMGEAFLSAGRAAEALSAFERVQQAKPDEALHAYNLARIESQQKRPAQALAKLEPYLAQKRTTQGTAPYQLLADALTELGQSNRLLARLEELRAADPTNLPLSYFLAQQYRAAKQPAKAEPIYAELIARHAARPPIEAYQALIDVQREQRSTEKLLSTLGDIVARVSNLAPLGDSGRALAADKELSKSIVAAAIARADADGGKLALGPSLAGALLAVEVEDYAAAERLFNMAIVAEPKKAGEIIVNWGLELFLANRYADAAKVFQRGLDEKLLPDGNPSLYFYLAGALEMDGHTDEAIVAADKAAELQKDSPRFASRAGWIQYHAKRYDAARQSYAALLEKYDKNHESSEVRETLRDARLVLSNIAVIEGKLPESEEWLEQVLDEFPEDVGALNDLGYLWADGGKHLERALEMIQVAVAADPKNMAYRDSLGWALFRLGRYPEAVAELRVAAAVDEPDGVILDHLASALEKNGEHAAAAETWRRAAAAFEKHAEPAKAKQATDKAQGAESAAAKNK